MQKNLIFIILFIFLLLLGAFYAYKTPIAQISPKNLIQSSSPAAARTPNQYTSEVYDFSIEYPFNLQLKESSPSAITIGTINDLETNSAVEVKVIEFTAKTNATESAAVLSAKNLCKNTMPNLEISCDKVINDNTSEVPATKIQLKSFYLEEVTKNKSTGEVVAIEQKGPFISYPLRKTKTVETFVLFYPPLDKDAHLTSSQLVKDIAESLTLNNTKH